MALEKNHILSISIMGLLFASIVLPVYAEVESVITNKQFYSKGEKINFSGTVSEDSNGLVTIVIRDPYDKFVLLTQAMINHDNTFERDVEINDKFSVLGTHNVTAFIVNMTAGSMTNFGYSHEKSPTLIDSEQSSKKEIETKISEPTNTIIEETTKISKIADFVDPKKDPKYYIERYNNEPSYKAWFDRNYPNLTIEEAVGYSEDPVSVVPQNQKIPGFPDPEIDPQHYVERYNTETTYKAWFDRNFPGQTIYEVVGATEPEIIDEKEIDESSSSNEPPSITQEASAMVVESSTITPVSESENTELSQMLLALGGLGVLFGAVYGVKRKVDSNTTQIEKNKTILQKKVENNSEQISQNRFWLKKKLMSLKSCDEPVTMIKERLAKGEITIDEYYRLLRALKKK